MSDKIQKRKGRNYYHSEDHSPQDSKEFAEKQHRYVCTLCKLDAAQPGTEQMVKEFYMRRMSVRTISGYFGTHTVYKSVPNPKKKKKGDENYSETVEQAEEVPNLPHNSIWNHSVFFGWDKERANNIDAILSNLIDIGLNQLQFSARIDERTLIHAIDMKNKMQGNYYKPGKNPKDMREQMKATVETILKRHKEKGLNPSPEEIIESLSGRPNFTHIKVLLKDEKWEK